MTPALKMVIKERMEQLEKHGFDDSHDDSHEEPELLHMSILALLGLPDHLDIKVPGADESRRIQVPQRWNRFKSKFRTKQDDNEKLAVAIALAVAHLDKELRDNCTHTYNYQSSDDLFNGKR